MTDECIHGFPTELCDICSPRVRVQPEAPAAAPAARRTRAATSLRSTPGGAPIARSAGPRAAGTRVAGARAVSDLPAPRVFSALRAHHFTHVDNLESIVMGEALEARSGAAPDFDVASAGAVAARAAVATPDGATAVDHVPFALSPDGAAWAAVRAGAEDGRWSDAARRARATEYVVLVVPTTAFGASVILADGDPMLGETRFAVGPEAATAMLRRTDLLDPEMHRVELLAGPRVPFESVAVIGVANERARASVRGVLREAGGHLPRVAVFPPWFVPETAD